MTRALTSSSSRAILAGAFACASLGAAPTAHAFWCEGSLVLVGDTMVGVRSACGEPASATTRIETTSFCSCCAGGVHVRGPHFGLLTTRTTQIDVWVYDFGYTRFMEQLEFEGGVLRRMSRLGRGSRTRRDRVDRRIELPRTPPTVWRRELGPR